jgi:aminocarboxymuconate-semialdehyde decarboxylase
MLVDMHAHVIPEQFPPAASRASANSWPSMDHFEAGRARVMINGENYRTVHNGSWDGERRIADMLAMGVDAEAISPMPELLSYWYTPQHGLDMCRYLNEFILGLVSAAPGRFYGLGIVPLQDPDLAAKELASVRAMGLQGIEIGSNVNGRSLGEPEFAGFFQEADRLGVPIFVHALRPTVIDRIGTALANPIGFPTDTGLTIGSFIGNGTAAKCPTLRIAWSHGGGTFPSMLPRFQHNWGGTWNEEPPADAASKGTSPLEYARRFYYDTLVFDRRLLRYMIDILGHTQLMPGSDYPFMARQNPMDQTLASMDLPQEVYNDITWNNFFRFLGIEVPAA